MFNSFKNFSLKTWPCWTALLMSGCILSVAVVAEEQPEYHLDHTQLGPSLVRVYCDGGNGDSARMTMFMAVSEARRLAREQGFSHFYLVDTKTLYRRDSVTRQPSYVARGQVETRGTRIGAGREMRGGEIDVDYNHGGQIRRRGTIHNRQGIVVNSNNPMFQGFSARTYRDRQPWAAVTVQFLTSDTPVSGRVLLSTELPAVDQEAEK